MSEEDKSECISERGNVNKIKVNKGKGILECIALNRVATGGLFKKGHLNKDLNAAVREQAL